MKRGLLLFLPAIIILSTCSESALAAESELAEYGKGYIAFGDSYTRGLGSTEYWYDEVFLIDGKPEEIIINNYGDAIHTTRFCRNVTGAFSKLVADAIGCNTNNDMCSADATYWPVANNGLTLSAVMDLLGCEDNYFDTEYLHRFTHTRNRYSANLYYYGSPGKSVNEDGTGVIDYQGAAGDINELIASARLITVELGMSDILNRTGFLIRAENGADAQTDRLSVFSDTVSTLVESFYEGFSYWEKNFPVLLHYLKENSDAVIIVLGAANPVFNASLTDTTLLPIGTAFSAITVRMNADMRKFCRENNCIFIDISNAETGITENEWSLFDDFLDNIEGPATHPTARGYEQIADAVITALQEREGTKQPAGEKDIVVDVGRFDSVDYVIVNGLCNRDYEMDGHVLTVHCKTKLAKKMTVAVERSGKLAITTYRLSYREGYEARRTYTTNSISRVFDNLVGSAKAWLRRLCADISQE